MARKTISQRMALVGAEEIRKKFEQLGVEGDKAFKEIQRSADRLKGPGAAFAKSMDDVVQSLKRAGDQIQAVGRKMRNAGAVMTVGVTAPLVAFAKKSMDAWSEQLQAITKVEAALKSTGGVSKKTSQELQETASRLQGLTTFGDEAILQMQAVLLTFTKIRGDNFDDATMGILNMSAALGTDLQSAALQVGKALNDPVAGISALSRAGVQFSDRQEAMIKRLAETGNTARAQKIILKELETQFGGMAEALAKTDPGKQIQAWNAWGDSLEEVGKVITPFVTRLLEMLRDLAERFNALPESTKETVVAIGAIAAAVGPVLTGLGLMVIGLGGAVTAMSGMVAKGALLIGFLIQLGIGLATAVAAVVGWPVLIAAGLAAAAVAIYSWWDEIKAGFAAFWGVLRDFVGPAMLAIVDAVASGAQSIAGAFVTAWEAAGKALGDAVDYMLGEVLGLGDDFIEAFKYVANYLSGGWVDTIKGAIDSVVGWASSALSALRSLVSAAREAAGFAGGGSVGGGGSGFAGGGQVRGPGTTTSDSILAWLSDKEFVIRARAVQYYGPRLFEALNRMRLPRNFNMERAFSGFREGGLAVRYGIPAMATGGAVPSRAGPYATINLTLGGRTFAGLMAPRQTAEELSRYVMSQEVRSGGRRPNWYRGG